MPRENIYYLRAPEYAAMPTLRAAPRVYDAGTMSINMFYVIFAEHFSFFSPRLLPLRATSLPRDAASTRA